jgi:hypothetical protein
MNTKLNVKQWAIASFAVFVVLSVLGFLMGKIEASMFQDLPIRVDPAVEDISMLRIWNYLGRAVYSLLFVFVYTKGLEGKSAITEGFRYGLWIGLLLNLSGFFGSLVTTNWPIGFLVFDKSMGFISTIIAGITAGALYKPQKPTS